MVSNINIKSQLIFKKAIYIIGQHNIGKCTKFLRRMEALLASYINLGRLHKKRT